MRESPLPDVVVVGSASIDLTLGVRRLPQPGQTVLADQRGLTRRPGGKGANQAVAAARLGATTALVGRVGGDEAAALVLDALTAAGVEVTGVSCGAEPTGLAVVLVDADGENSIVVAPGANAALSVQDVDAHRQLVAAARVVLLSLEVPMSALERAAGHATGLVVLNPAPMSRLPRGLIDRVDVLVPNRGELAELLDAPVPTAVSEAAAMTRAVTARTGVVVTLGAQGALVSDSTGVRHLPAPPVEAVDTVGAGDAFCAALAVGLARSLTLTEAAEKAVAAGAAAVLAPGAQPPLPPFDEL